MLTFSVQKNEPNGDLRTVIAVREPAIVREVFRVVAEMLSRLPDEEEQADRLRRLLEEEGDES